MQWQTEWHHRYVKKSRLLKFCYVPAISAASSKGIFAAITNSTKKTSEAGDGLTGAINQSIFLRFLWVAFIKPLGIIL
jgi:hypothetical protein